MNTFLRKINLIIDLKIELQISKIDFIKKFRENVDESNLGFEPFEVFTSSKNEYKGTIENNGFELKKRRKIFDTNYSFAKATGHFVEETDQLIIKTEISGFQRKMLVFLGFFLLFYIIMFSSFLFSDTGNVSLFVLPFLVFHMAFMLGIPYLIMRRSVKRMVYDLERDFHYWVTKK